jgi:hypothetical protein
LQNQCAGHPIGPIVREGKLSETSVTTTILGCIKYQKRAYLIYTAVETWIQPHKIGIVIIIIIIIVVVVVVVVVVVIIIIIIIRISQFSALAGEIFAYPGMYHQQD